MSKKSLPSSHQLKKTAKETLEVLHDIIRGKANNTILGTIGQSKSFFEKKSKIPRKLYEKFEVIAPQIEIIEEISVCIAGLRALSEEMGLDLVDFTPLDKTLHELFAKAKKMGIETCYLEEKASSILKKILKLNGIRSQLKLLEAIQKGIVPDCNDLRLLFNNIQASFEHVRKDRDSYLATLSGKLKELSVNATKGELSQNNSDS